MLGSIPKQSKRRRKGEGKSRPALPPTRAGIVIKGHLTRATVGLQKDDHRFHRCLFVEVLVFPGQTRRPRCQHPQNYTLRSHAGACPGDFVEADTLLTSLRIHLNLFQWLPRLSGPSFPLWLGQDTPVFPQELPDRSTGARQTNSRGGPRPDRVADNRAGPAGLACVPSAPGETDASPRCGFRRTGPSGSRAYGAPASANTTGGDRWDRLRTIACAIS